MKEFSPFSIVSLINLAFREKLSKGLKVFPGAYLTNSKELICSLLSASVRADAGNLEFHEIANSKAVLFSTQNISTDVPLKYDNLSDLNAFLLNTEFLLQCFWLVKDHAISVDHGFNEFPHHSTQSRVSSNGFGSSYSYRADGSSTATIFSNEELEVVGTIFGFFVKDNSPPPKFIRQGFSKTDKRFFKGWYSLCVNIR